MPKLKPRLWLLALLVLCLPQAACSNDDATDDPPENSDPDNNQALGFEASFADDRPDFDAKSYSAVRNTLTNTFVVGGSEKAFGDEDGRRIDITLVDGFTGEPASWNAAEDILEIEFEDENGENDREYTSVSATLTVTDVTTEDDKTKVSGSFTATLEHEDGEQIEITAGSFSRITLQEVP